MIEFILTDYFKAYGLNSVTLRLFNVCGADPEHKLGEVKNAITHLIPSVMDTALGRRDVFKIFGTEYDTRDGTAIRDYNHVWDVAKAFEMSIGFMNNNLNAGDHVFNIGALEDTVYKKWLMLWKGHWERRFRGKTRSI